MAIEATLTTTIPAPGFLFDFAFSPDGRWLALATAKRVPVVEVATGRTRFAVRHGSWLWRGVLGVAFSPDGRWLATCGQWDRAARIWDAATGRQLHRIPHEFVDNPGAGRPKVQTVAFSPDGRLLATAGSGNAVRVWDTASGEEVAAFSHDRRTWDVAFSPDGRWLATCGGDCARVWDAHSGQELLMVRNEEASPAGMGLMQVAFSADGQLLATNGRAGRRLLDDVVRVWRLREGADG